MLGATLLLVWHIYVPQAGVKFFEQGFNKGLPPRGRVNKNTLCFFFLAYTIVCALDRVQSRTILSIHVHGIRMIAKFA